LAQGLVVKYKKHLNKKWEISIIELQNSKGKKYKVTRHLPELKVSETKIFSSKKKAKKLFDEWLN
jgi:hypothetical protein